MFSRYPLVLWQEYSGIVTKHFCGYFKRCGTIGTPDKLLGKLLLLLNSGRSQRIHDEESPRVPAEFRCDALWKRQEAVSALGNYWDHLEINPRGFSILIENLWKLEMFPGFVEDLNVQKRWNVLELFCILALFVPVWSWWCLNQCFYTKVTFMKTCCFYFVKTNKGSFMSKFSGGRRDNAEAPSRHRDDSVHTIRELLSDRFFYRNTRNSNIDTINVGIWKQKKSRFWSCQQKSRFWNVQFLY